MRPNGDTGVRRLKRHVHTDTAPSLALPTDIEKTIVLASDGYPYLKDSLEASEHALQGVLRDDPLLFRTYKATKGIQQGNLSFDDRAYVKITRKEHAEE